MSMYVLNVCKSGKKLCFGVNSIFLEESFCSSTGNIQETDLSMEIFPSSFVVLCKEFK
jgi:hypothetical protein